MKLGITITALTAIALTALVATEAHGWWYKGPDINQRFSGFTDFVDTQVDSESGVTLTTTSRQDLYPIGKPGRANLNSTVVFGQFVDDDECDEEFGLPQRAEILSIVAVETFRDGSTLGFVGLPGNSLCGDSATGTFTTDIVSLLIISGTGRFQGATGKAYVENPVVTAPGIFTGHITGTFD